MLRNIGSPIEIAPVWLPEFGLSVSWAMCRNPMCANFGAHFEGEIPVGRKQTSDERYYVRVIPGARGRPTGVIQCRYCGQSAQLASNRAIRPVARYFLSLSLPFADCPNRDCQNHGVNLFEHWVKEAGQRPRPIQKSRVASTGIGTAGIERSGSLPGEGC